MINKIIFIRRDNIGDLVCTTPAIAAARQSFPGAKIGILVNTYNADIVSNNPDINEVYVYKKAKHSTDKGKWSIWLDNARLLLRIRREKYDVAIGCGSFSPMLARYTLLTGAKRRIGYCRRGSTNVSKNVYYTDPICPTEGSEHETIKIFRLLEPIGIAGRPGRMIVYPLRQEMDKFAAFRTVHRSYRARPLIAIAISARIKANKWPVEKFAELISTLLDRNEENILLLWAPGSRDNPTFPGENEIAQDIIDRFTGRILAYPTSTISSLIAAIAASDIVVTLDTGSLHISAGLQKPTVALMTKAKEPSWYPWDTRNIVISADKNVEAIPVGTVVGAVEKLLHEMVT